MVFNQSIILPNVVVGANPMWLPFLEGRGKPCPYIVVVLLGKGKPYPYILNDMDFAFFNRFLTNLYSCSMSFNFASHSSSASTSNRKTLFFTASPNSDRLLALASLLHSENISIL